jgi:hypothetical protein
LKEKESKAKPFYIPWNPESSIGIIIRVFSQLKKTCMSTTTSLWLNKHGIVLVLCFMISYSIAKIIEPGGVVV